MMLSSADAGRDMGWRCNAERVSFRLPLPRFGVYYACIGDAENAI